MKCILFIGGSDSGGGAGLQADIKTAEQFGCFATTAVTAVTAQNTTGVTDVTMIDPMMVAKQIQAVLDDFPVHAVKIGMVGTADVARALYDTLRGIPAPILLDPVAVSKAGSPLLDDDAVSELGRLARVATVITPNRHEAKKLFGIDPLTPDDMLYGELKEAGLGKNHTILKNFRGDDEISTDLCVTPDGTLRTITSHRSNSASRHGSGCSYAAALTCLMANGMSVEKAAKRAKMYVFHAMEAAPGFGKGPGPLNHAAGYDAVRGM